MIMEGSYFLDPDSLDAQEAKDQDWSDMSAQFRSKEQVMEFILLQGGTIHVTAKGNEDLVIGGCETNSRVSRSLHALHKIDRSQNIQKPKTEKQKQLQDGTVGWCIEVDVCLFLGAQGAHRAI